MMMQVPVLVVQVLVPSTVVGVHPSDQIEDLFLVRTGYGKNPEIYYSKMTKMIPKDTPLLFIMSTSFGGIVWYQQVPVW
jgi:hypothetical protein